jgi:hypothetical protein
MSGVRWSISSIYRSTMYYVIALTVSVFILTRSIHIHSYEISIGNVQHGRPEVNRQTIAGIWKLIPTTYRTPMKEFTVYPKQPQIVPPELLLLLKEDGSFQQYQYETTTGAATSATASTTTIDDENNLDIDTSWKQFYNSKTNQLLLKQQQTKLYPWIQSIQTGKWNYLDGYLLLAADRIQQQKQSSTTSTTTGTTMKSVLSNDNAQSSSTTTTTAATSSSFSHRSNDDTLLKGRVIANFQTRLEDNPILSSISSKDDTNITTPPPPPPSTSIQKSNTNNNKKIQLDTYLTIPRGTIHIGKFMYPKHHPSFFDQPMYQPIKMGTCTLRQIIGNVNMANYNNNNNNSNRYDKGSLKSNHYINQNNYNHDDDTITIVESFQRSDFYNKTFLLTSHPLRTQPLTFSTNDPYNNKKKDSKTMKSSSSSSSSSTPSTGSVVRVLQIIFHPNNTFTTTGGLGNDIILRGKYDIIGNNYDHLWMQVIRFGFGRSVSGSVYSEGTMLSHEDIKAYWGTIRKVPYTSTSTTSNNNNTQSINHNNNSSAISNTEFHHDDVSSSSSSSSFRIEVDGSVLDGIGLEPIPVARFMLREIDSSVSSINNMDDDDDGDDDDDDDEEGDDSNIDQLKTTIDIVLEDDGIDWTSTDESFQ